MDSIWSYDQSKVNTVENNMDITLRLGMPYSVQSYSWNSQTITHDIIPSRLNINTIGSSNQSQRAVDSIWAYDQTNHNSVENNMDITQRLGLLNSDRRYSWNRLTLTPNDIIPSLPNINAIGSFGQLSQRPVAQHGLGSAQWTQQPLALLPRGHLNHYLPGCNTPMRNAGVGQAMHRTPYVQQGWGQQHGVHCGQGFVQQHQRHVRSNLQQMFPRGCFHCYPPRFNTRVPGFTGALPFQVSVGTMAGALATATHEQQRIMLGELLYPRVEQFVPDVAAKVTGMLLEMDRKEILFLLESPNALSLKVAEAIAVLREANQQQKDNLAGQLGFVSLNDQD
ncbi:polyadenylate-binding protein 8-like isoform X4 [Tripterygium wilfordii]|uniref:polyadenylate-binding protein 8-like isoform X4 n=1 Tax=Tripterygium wilfordii TaxID=458696 RepID=UPI0018F84D36|nr:polyadenylate-binding protein 8-like isoform X4 [Tripterygium wilfordii]